MRVLLAENTLPCLFTKKLTNQIESNFTDSNGKNYLDSPENGDFIESDEDDVHHSNSNISGQFVDEICDSSYCNNSNESNTLDDLNLSLAHFDFPHLNVPFELADWTLAFKQMLDLGNVELIKAETRVRRLLMLYTEINNVS